MTFLLRVSQTTVVLMAFGWLAVVYVATYMPGGHPPLSAFVGIAVIVASWILGTIGVIAGMVSRQRGARLAVFFNAVLLVFSVLVNFM